MSTKTPEQEAARFLYNNRLHKNIENIAPSQYPQSAEHAYKIQHVLVEMLTGTHNSKVCGYKIACTNTMAQQLLGVDGPLSGRMMTHSTFQDGAILEAQNFSHRLVELEYVFVMEQDAKDVKQPYSAQTIKPLIKDLLPGIEIVDHRFPDFSKAGANALIADNAVHGVSVLGNPTEDWHSVDLASHTVNLIVNDQVFSSGSGENVLGHPLNAMAWLANHLISHDSHLKSGDIVTTGVACDIHHAVSGDRLCADFGDLGKVSCAFT
jgi:2-oxo-3-hexenedioate decarboxylase/2-keto-4-pentenoate hydratase